MKVLVIGSGGREHALVWKIAQSRRVKKIYALPGNDGMASLAELVNLKMLNVIEIAEFARQEDIDLTVVGPEAVLSLGLVDEFHKHGLKIFGPTQRAAMLESSKAFAKDFMKKHHIPTSGYRIFDSASETMDYLGTSKFPVVVKADGLAAGKGVFICHNMEEAQDAIRATMVENKFGKAGEKVVVEDFLSGQEMSFMALSDGKRAIPLVTSMDYKKCNDGDKGPNTGGMGAISPAPLSNRVLINDVMKSIIQPAIAGMREDGREFKGILYAGLMIKNNQPFVLEFNVRFGDPETQALMLRLNSDLVDLLEGAADGNITDIPMEWSEQVSACVVVASKGYPDKYETEKKISGLDRAKSKGVEIFHAGTSMKNKAFYTAGGRVLNISTTDITLKDAIKKIYDAISFIEFENIYFRQDIGRAK